MSAPTLDRIRTEWSDGQQAALAGLARRKAARLRCQRLYPSALDLALGLTRGTVETPALRLISTEIRRAIETPGSRLVISMPPQEGKSTMIRHAAVTALARNPDCAVAVASYALPLARAAGRWVRNFIQAYGSSAMDPASGEELPDRLGISVASDHAAAADWSLAEGRGGLYCIGLGGGLTGHRVDLLIVDDPVKDQQDADSETVRAALHDWWTAVAETRLGPAPSIIVIQTRWHEDDLAGRLIAQDAEAEQPEWRVINIPAYADGETLDSLGREPGTWLESARGRTAAAWQKIRRRVGERVFAALYQGRPAPLEGGIFQRAWIEQHRVTAAPPLVRTVVGCDPSDTGTGDQAGILVAGRAADRHLYVLRDYSGPLSQAQWARRACLAWLRHDAAAIVVERTLGMGSSVRDAWSLLRRQAAALVRAVGDVPAALADLAEGGDTAAADEAQLTELAGMGVAVDILRRVSTGPRVVRITPRASKQVRAESITSLYEGGRAHHVGRLPELEHEMVTWLPGQKSPNRLDTLAHLLTHLDVTPTRPGTVDRGARAGAAAASRGPDPSTALVPVHTPAAPPPTTRRARSSPRPNRRAAGAAIPLTIGR